MSEETPKVERTPDQADPENADAMLREVEGRLAELDSGIISASLTTIFRHQLPEEVEAIAAVTAAAFANSQFGHNGEAELIERIRTNCANHISIVAVTEGEVEGHILFSRAWIRTADSRIAGMALAPMAVAPEYQRSGVGSQLMETGLHQLDLAGCPFVVVLGHPDYYPRFGFKPAAESGLSHGFEGMPQHVFFIRWHEETTLPAMQDAKAWFNKEFGPQHISQ